MGKYADVYSGKIWHCKLCDQDCKGRDGFGAHKRGKKHSQRYAYSQSHPDLIAEQIQAIFDPVLPVIPTGQTQLSFGEELREPTPEEVKAVAEKILTDFKAKLPALKAAIPGIKFYIDDKEV